ncbi:MAG: glycosyltransferase family 4 protein, partial [Planctomycetota bacterium]
RAGGVTPQKPSRRSHAPDATARPAMAPPHRILIISQVYVPDPAAVGQYMADAAEALAARGHDVRVLTSASGYDDPSIKYARREVRGGVQVRRMPLSSFGKRTIAHRLLGQGLFLAQVLLHGLFSRRPAAVLVSTSPPMASIAALVIGVLRRAPITYWVMDLNPDQVIATGVMKPTSLPVRALDWLNRRILSRAAKVAPLDRFMADRLRAKFAGDAGRLQKLEPKITVLPPWPMVEPAAAIPRGENAFRRRHGLGDRRVVMYSGNHGMTTPVDTLVDAALRLRDDPRLVFVFVGAGPGKRCVEEAIARHAPPNLLSLPYQPLADLPCSLSAADVHVVLMNERLVGIVHPCKVYGAMSVGRPLLYFGPRASHITELLDEGGIGWRATQGDVDSAVAALEEIASAPAADLHAKGAKAQAMLAGRFSAEKLRNQFCDTVTATF